jgi:hypothetical protein
MRQDAEPGDVVSAVETLSVPAGIAAQHTPWKPSHPAMKSHSNLLLRAVVVIANRRAGAVDIRQRRRRLEEQAPTPRLGRSRIRRPRRRLRLARR